MNDEMISHKNNKIWILMNEAFKNRKIFIDKWVYKCKKNIHEKITRYKIRWCVKNFKQLKDFDYHEIFVSMIKSMCQKCNRDNLIFQIDHVINRITTRTIEP